MSILPDPRCFAAPSANPLQELAAQIAAEPDATQRDRFLRELRDDLQQTLRAGRDDLLSAALSDVSSPQAGRCLWEATDRALNTPDDAAATLSASLFALPVVFVAAGPDTREVPGTVRDADRLARVLEQHGALGEHRTFGLNQALCAETSVESFSLSSLYALLRRVEKEHVDVWPGLIPAPIELDGDIECVVVRYVTGLMVAGVDAPSLSSTAADVARWGMPFARELIAQLSQRGVTLLPIPRPPHGLLVSLHRGHRAREEIGFQTFLTRVLRQMRSSVGEPEVSLSAVRPDAIVIRLSSPLDGQSEQLHRWQLHPLDDLADVSSSITDLLKECQVQRIQVIEQLEAPLG
jgi:hypothetical protein